MKLIYVSGKYRDNSSIGVIENIFHATEASYRLWGKGWAVICPHMNTAHFRDLPHKLIMPGDFEMVRRCDALYMLKGWQESKGAVAEHKLALSLGLEILYEE